MADNFPHNDFCLVPQQEKIQPRGHSCSLDAGLSVAYHRTPIFDQTHCASVDSEIVTIAHSSPQQTKPYAQHCKSAIMAPSFENLPDPEEDDYNSEEEEELDFSGALEISGQSGRR